MTSTTHPLHDILIVDDNPENLRTLSVTLEQEGYRVRAAIDGETALLAASAEMPDLILLDVRMPVMDGYEVCVRLKALPETGNTPIIFLSALDNLSDKLRGFEAGAVDYITKPFQRDEVLARVKTHLTLYEQQKTIRALAQEREEMLNIIRLSDARLRAILDSSQTGFILLNMDAEIILSNHKAHDLVYMITGRIPADGVPMQDYVQTQHLAKFEQHFDSALRGENITIEQEQHSLINEQIRWYEFRHFPVYLNHAIIGVCLSIEDITERKLTNIALQEAEYRYRTVADFSADWTYWVREDSRLNYISPVCASITGYSVSDFEANPQLLDEIVHPDDKSLWHTHHQEHSTGNTPGYLQFRIQHRAGHTVWIEHACRRVFDADGKPDGYRVSNRDISERIEAEQAKLRLQVEQERVHLINSFIHDIHHEFRSPLSIINSAVHLISRKTDDEAFRERKLQQIIRQTRHITALVDSLVLMTRLDTEDPGTKQPLKLNHLIEMTLQSLDKAIREKQLTLHFADADKRIIIPGYEIFLKEAFYQVLHNAIRYTPENGQIEIHIQSTDTLTTVTIDDTGIGIPEPQLPEIFKSFKRVDSARSTGGLGLGLPIARRVLELHNGVLTLENRPDAGIRASIILPV